MALGDICGEGRSKGLNLEVPPPPLGTLPGTQEGGMGRPGNSLKVAMVAKGDWHEAAWESVNFRFSHGVPVKLVRNDLSKPPDLLTSTWAVPLGHWAALVYPGRGTEGER